MNSKYKTVYKMDIAIELQKLGHKVASTAANPNNSNYIIWIFEVDDTFYDDFNKLKAIVREKRG